MRLLAGVLAWLVLGLSARAADVPPVDVVLSLVQGPGQAKAGGPLRLDLVFLARAAGAELREFRRDVVPGVPTDELVVRAEDGGEGPWVYDRPRWVPDLHDIIRRTALPVGEAVHRSLVLNDWVRFERPGRYTVQVRTRRVAGQPPVWTNAVSVQVDLPSPAEEADRVSELAGGIRSAPNVEQARHLIRELGWLGGELAADLQLDLLLHRDGANPHCVSVDEGLWRARDRRRLVQRLEQALDDPAQPLTASDALLWKLTQLRFSLDGVAPLVLEQVGAESRRFGYVQRLARSLPLRDGDARWLAASTVLEMAEPGSPEADAAASVLQAHSVPPKPACPPDR